MKAKKDSKAKGEKSATEGKIMVGEVTNAADLKAFLLSVRDKMTEEVAAPIYVVSVMNYMLSTPEIYQHLNDENKEIARDLWLRLKQAGMQVRNPPMLFGPADADGAGPLA